MNDTVISPTGKELRRVGKRTTTRKEDSAAKQLRVVSAQNARRTENLAYLNDPNVKAFLYMIQKSEGGDYHAMYGWIRGRNGWTFTDESTHPGPGKDGSTTAAGMYQINKACWTQMGIRAQGLTDFSPQTQDLIAVENLRAFKCLDLIIAGNIETPIKILAPAQWSSFQKHTYAVLKAWFVEGGGTVK